MHEFINPDNFSNDEEMLDHIIDNVVVPSLHDQIGEDALEHVQGVAYVFGGRGDINPQVLQRLQSMIEHDAIPLEYALREFTTLKVGKKKHSQRGGLQVNYIELIGDDSGVDILSDDELAEMFAR
ncbi:MAG: hypothetical protein EA401_13265 [Planctomycetota bacterium]|nr:MAG: hypothetical protein EA401_13265 [Planctomycetota bacterium]